MAAFWSPVSPATPANSITFVGTYTTQPEGVQKEEESSATMTRHMPLVFETFLERLSQSIDEADFRDAMAEAAGRLDLIFFAYLSLPARPSGKPRLISNYPPRWTRQYLENQYEKLDPVVLRARNGGCPFHWGSNLGGDKMSPAQQQLFD
ncbi:autoinducer binding domain-containing protein, partial [Mesorhizobium sp. M7A.F.Ca.US.007.01.1.1]|uniref:autoinducer binding domain-containing protein n=1 Tax=Mesorhizobium sp. M7A.F.Ca.US.007.01.1.1 TaxID=2496712 RepID=UPI001FE15272